ncbi:phosphonopyruvate decarboxylase [Paenibacillus sp. NEAU-GSW1]|uniref:phosphonopyruvate decarboxylase n=1 Tax=Paenibacillus sp. NEAU-GSW1 TaxID=2682486 RepID=UPI0012E1ED03|nr:phosphonopyruvate decarboxylase [Paenibacillus sp. NEAU-GSW1]MUT68019.1 phosphonopyruvate decarboxylase [Paenibacillus sp. NEAU-GSW1]
MLNTNMIGAELKNLGFQFYAGVPCSFLKDLINYAINECEYVAAANEGDAVAIASGASLAGRKAVVLMQNSGLTNAVSPLVSLNYPFQIPVLGFVSLRGEPGIPDEPQHELMGRMTVELLSLMEVEWAYLSPDSEEARRQLLLAADYIAHDKPFFFVVRKGTFEKEKLQKQSLSASKNRVKKSKQAADELPSRQQALKVINSLKDSSVVQLATTGKTGRQLYEIEDAVNNLYMVGSMGCVSSLALGIALCQPDYKIVAVDGDGSLLMRMGSLATNSCYNPRNLLHVVLDNNAHDSTGGQSTVSHNVDFVEIAASCGYENAIYIHSLSELSQAIAQWKQTKGLTFLCMKIAKGSGDEPGRPQMKPFQVKERLESFLQGSLSGSRMMKGE